MNDDSLPSFAAPSYDEQTDEATRVPSESTRPRTSTRRRPKNGKRSKHSDPGLKKKLEHVTHLLKTLDFVVFAELSSLYYMECSMVRFLLRVVGHSLLLTPNDENHPLPMPVSQVHISLVVVPNIVCLLVHLFASIPRGPDFHRGYQHGGVLVDFIGQKPPAYSLYYLLADLLILAVQGLMLSVHSQREKLRIALNTFPGAATEAAQRLVAEQTLETLDAEERGMRRRGSSDPADVMNDIEMQTLQPSFEEEGEENRREMDGTSRSGRQRRLSGNPFQNHLSDVMISGNAVIGQYDIVQTIRKAAWNPEGSAALSFQNIGYGATMAALQARQRTATTTQQ